MNDTITAAMVAYDELAVASTPAYQTAWRSWAVGVYEFVAGGDTGCAGPLWRTPCSGTCTDRPIIEYPPTPGFPWATQTFVVGWVNPWWAWSTVGRCRDDGAGCEDACSICGGPNTAAFEGEGWCDGCDQDARLGGDAP